MSKQGTGFNLQNGLPNPKNIDLGALGVSPKRVEMPKGKVVGFDIEREDVLEYNDTLLQTDDDGNLVFDEMYTSLTFSPDKVLVRLFLQEPKVSKAGIMTYPNTPYETLAIQTEGGSGRRYEHDRVKNPFKFMLMGIVVKGNNNFKQGQIVQVPPSVPAAQKLRSKNWIEYSNSFIHPLSGLVTPEQNPKNRFFGYAIFDYYSIQSILNFDDVLKYFYRDEK